MRHNFSRGGAKQKIKGDKKENQKSLSNMYENQLFMKNNPLKKLIDKKSKASTEIDKNKISGSEIHVKNDFNIVNITLNNSLVKVQGNSIGTSGGNLETKANSQGPTSRGNTASTGSKKTLVQMRNQFPTYSNSNSNIPNTASGPKPHAASHGTSTPEPNFLKM
jgi:hypothetical protein